MLVRIKGLLVEGNLESPFKFKTEEMNLMKRTKLVERMKDDARQIANGLN